MDQASVPAGRPSGFKKFLDAIGESERVRPTGLTAAVIAALSVAAALVITYLALFGIATEHLQGSYFLLFLLPTAFLTTTISKSVMRLSPVEFLLAAASLAVSLWFVLNEDRYADWISGVSEMTAADIVAGTLLVALSIELCRRTVGLGLTVIVFLLFAYVVFGGLLQGSFRHDGIAYPYFIEMQTVTTDGVFGSPLYATASYAFLFVLFGNFFMAAGGGQLFFDVAAAATGRLTGGPAKACITSSALYGMISGSPVADVATTGPISIPIMRRIGISAERAGAIEAAASTGGGILPPVMGAVAFIMADFTGIPYHLIALYATLPCIAYYVGIYALVHFEAVRLDLGRVPESEIVGLKVAFARNWPSVVPIATLLWLLVAGYSAAYVAAGSTVAVLVSSWAKRSTAIGPRAFVDACVETCQSMAPLIGAVATAGVIIGCIEMTGLSGKFTLLLFELSGGLLIPTLILTAVVLILLGMGMPTTAVYIMGIALLAPMLITKFQIPLLVTHMFILFFACMSAITPPVAVAAFAAGMIAKANPMRIGLLACQLSVGGFLIPFFFLFNRGILVQGDAWDVVSDSSVGMIMVIAASVALYGWVHRSRMSWLSRAAFAAAALGMMYPSRPLQWALVAAAVGTMALLRKRAKRQAGRAPAAA